MENKKQKIKQPLTKGVAKVPVVMQMEALECGAASLAMICAYYDKWIPLEQIRLDCGVSRDGANAKNILVAARNYGFTAKGYRYEPDDLKKYGKFPCIIHWNFNHFVVLDGFKGKKAVINDPAKGSYTVSMETFDKSFTGICLMFEPNEEFAPSGKRKSVLSFAISRLRGAKTAVAFVVFTTLISALIGIITPAFSRIFMDRLLTKESPEWFYPFMIALSVMSALQLMIAALETYYSNRINGKLASVGSSTFLWKVLHLPMEFFSQRLAGDIQGRQGSNAGIWSAINSEERIDDIVTVIIILAVFYLLCAVGGGWLISRFIKWKKLPDDLISADGEYLYIFTNKQIKIALNEIDSIFAGPESFLIQLFGGGYGIVEIKAVGKKYKVYFVDEANTVPDIVMNHINNL